MYYSPFVSIVVPTYNRAAVLGDCLDSLLGQDYPKDCFEVVVVNDGSKDRTEEVLRSYEEKAKCGFKWVSQENSGISVALNVGIKIARGEIICFTADDCIADKNWINYLLASYSTDKIGGVGGKIIGNIRSSNLIERYSEVIGILDGSKSTDKFLVGANSSYRKEVLDKINGFDPFFKTSAEDHDVGIRTIIEGYSLAYSSKAIVYHKHRSSLKSLFKQIYRYGKGYARLHKKYPKIFPPLKQISFYSRLILQGVLLYPLMIVKSFFVRDKTFYLTKRLLDIFLLTFSLMGMLYEISFGEDYPDQKIKKVI